MGMDTENKMLYWGFDLGDGESAVARVGGGESRFPEIVEVDGKKIVITVWAVMPNGEVRIGDSAARSASSAVSWTRSPTAPP